MQEGWRIGSIPNADPAPCRSLSFWRTERGAGGKGGRAGVTHWWWEQRIHTEGHREEKSSPGMKVPQKGV